LGATSGRQEAGPRHPRGASPVRARAAAGAAVLAGLVLGGSGPARGVDPPACASEATARVQARYDGVRDLAAAFEQTTRSVTLGGSSLADDEVATGRVVLAKPGRMRWEYERPEPSLVVSDGRLLWLYDPAAREVQRLQVDQGFLSGAALQFLLGGGRLEEEFRVEATSCDEQRAELRLLPRQDAPYARLGLTVERESGDIVATTIVDLLGNETRIRFRDLRYDQAPAAERFRFEVPEGVSVIEAGPAS